MWIKKLSVLAFVTLLLTKNACAVQEVSPEVAGIYRALNSLWVLGCTGLILGMALLGWIWIDSRSRKKLIKGLPFIISVASVAFLTYLAMGFSWMYGPSKAGLIGGGKLFLSGPIYQGMTLPKEVFFPFQSMICILIVLMAVAFWKRKLGRWAFVGTVGMSGIGFPILGHWVWAGGWLSEWGFLDFGGAAVVWGLVASNGLVKTFFEKQPGRLKPKKLKVVPWYALAWGTCGIGLIGGHTLSGIQAQWIGQILLNIMLTMATSALVAGAGASLLNQGKKGIGMGYLAGMTASCAGAGFLTPVGSFCTGVGAGILIVGILRYWPRIPSRLQSPIFWICGIPAFWGLLAVGLCHPQEGLLYHGGWHLLVLQGTGLLVCLGYTIFATAGFFALPYIVMNRRKKRVS